MWPVRDEPPPFDRKSESDADKKAGPTADSLQDTDEAVTGPNPSKVTTANDSEPADRPRVAPTPAVDVEPSHTPVRRRVSRSGRRPQHPGETLSISRREDPAPARTAPAAPKAFSAKHPARNPPTAPPPKCIKSASAWASGDERLLPGRPA